MNLRSSRLRIPEYDRLLKLFLTNRSMHILRAHVRIGQV